MIWRAGLIESCPMSEASQHFYFLSNRSTSDSSSNCTNEKYITLYLPSVSKTIHDIEFFCVRIQEFASDKYYILTEPDVGVGSSALAICFRKRYRG